MPTRNVVWEWKFPRGTTLCDQVLDDSMTSANPLGLNTIVGYRKQCLAQH